MDLLILFGISFVFIALKAVQQINVAFRHLAAIVPTSILMGLVEFPLIGLQAALFVEHGYNAITGLIVGVGSGLGALVACVSHRRAVQFLTKGEKK